MHHKNSGSLKALAEEAFANQQWDEAERLFRQAINHLEIAIGHDHLEVASMLHCLARVLHHLGRDPESEQLRLRADQIMCSNEE